MSLAEAVSMVAESMDLEAQGTPAPEVAAALRRHVLNLRIAVKASAGAPSLAPDPNPIAAMQAAARREFSGRARQEEAAGEQTVGLVGGPVGSEDVPTFVQVAAAMPVGAKTVVAGSVYVLGEDRQLHYSEDETKRLKSVKPKPAIVTG